MLDTEAARYTLIFEGPADRRVALRAMSRMSDDEPRYEISASLAKELLSLQIATLIDVRQPFELEVEGRIEGAEGVPLFNLKQFLGHVLNAEEQEILDADVPTARDVQRFLATMNRNHYQQGNILLCLCNSGKRSLHAAHLLRSIGYARAFSVEGGVRVWRLLP